MFLDKCTTVSLLGRFVSGFDTPCFGCWAMILTFCLDLVFYVCTTVLDNGRKAVSQNKLDHKAEFDDIVVNCILAQTTLDTMCEAANRR